MDSPYAPVNGLVRGLSILNELNRLAGGAGIMQLAALTGLHRTTVRRLLQTLIREGYVRRSPSNDSYHLDMKVRELSEGFRDEHWISSLAAPLLGELLQKVAWPTDLCTLDGDAMVIRETTHRFSRLSFHRAMVGRRLPLLQTATGRTYLAFCPDVERAGILSLLQKQVDFSMLQVEEMLAKVREQGYGENTGEWGLEQNIGAIAVPIRAHDRVYGCINLVYLQKAMTATQAAAKHLSSLYKVTADIEAGLLQVG